MKTGKDVENTFLTADERIKMPYSARFHRHETAVFRLDTRIYLHDGVTPREDDFCVAAIVGKNPGSAYTDIFDTFSALRLRGDKMLPGVRNRFVSAYRRASKPIPHGGFIRVWNLFYLCDAKLPLAIKSYKAVTLPLSCPSETEKNPPSIVWFAWGGPDTLLGKMKERFRKMTPRRSFFYDKNRSKIVDGMPQPSDFAKHPQGLRAEPVIDFLSKIL